MELLTLIWLKIVELSQLFWAKVIITLVWAFITYIFQLQEQAHTAMSVVILLDGLVGMAHARVRGDFSQQALFNKFRVKLFAYAIIVLTGWAIDLAIVKGHADFGVHYLAVVYITLTEASSISNHLEAFNIKVPFKARINAMLIKMYNDTK